jgi:hypothetical protein
MPPTEVRLWPCLHTVLFGTSPRKGDIVLCLRCDDYREVVPEDNMEEPMSPEELGSKEGTIKRGAKPGAKYRRRKSA